MISKIIVPDLGATGDEVNLVQWLVEAGGWVEQGAPLFAVETDKATVEVEAFRAGYLRSIMVPAGGQAKLGATVAIMSDSMDEPLDHQQVPPSTPAETTAPPRDRRSDETTEQPTGPSGRIMASPAARRLAGEHGIDLSTVNASAPEGKIHKRDVLRAVGEKSDQVTAPVPEPGVRYAPVSAMRKAIAQRTQLSKSQAPHFYVAVEIDMGSGQEFRSECVSQAEANGQAAPTITDIIIRAAAMALRETPQLNTSFREDRIAYFKDIHIGLVVALPEGMIVPVIRNADQRDIYTLADITGDLRAKAKSGNLSSTELTGSTFTVSNLGMFGVDGFVAVINPPESAILALGAIRPHPAVFEGKIVARPVMTATLSADHRTVDGTEAARFLGRFKQLLENPLQLASGRWEEKT